MNNLDAAAALASMEQTEARLADRAHWSFRRHAMFGLVEGLLIAGLAQPMAIGGSMAAGAMALLVACIMGDRRRDGMFVSGLQGRSTRPLMIALFLFLAAALVAALSIRNGKTVEPLGFALGGLVMVVCTWASLKWEKLYRAELTPEEAR